MKLPDARLEPLLANMALDVCEPWRIRRSGGGAGEWQEWDGRQAQHRKEAAGLVREYTDWAETAVAAPHKEAREGLDQKWWQQQRAVISVFEMELAVRELGLVWLDETERLVASLREERAGIEDERGGRFVGGERGAVSEAAPMASPDERLNHWAQHIAEATASRLPDHSELVEPGKRPGWRTARPREAFRTSLALHGRKALQDIVEGYWERGASIARDVARARELVEYWGDAGDAELLKEARANAAAMLSTRLAEAEAGEELDQRLLASFSAWSEEGYAALEAGQFGWLSLLRRGGAGGWAWRYGRRPVGSGGGALAALGGGTLGGLLEAFGWRPIRPVVASVVRVHAAQTLSLPASKLSLPGIYRSLFQVAPVSDERFLVGRDDRLPVWLRR